jgi:thiamine biosynthesis lipoprotein
MGTSFHITLVAPPSDTDMDALRPAIHSKLEHVESIASTYRDTSELSLFNRNVSTDWIATSPEFCQMMDASIAVSTMTKGAFDMTVGPLVNLWGFGPTNMTNELPTDEEILQIRSSVGYQQLAVDCDNSRIRKASANTFVDLSGWAKGHAVDEIAAILDARNIENYIVEIGGELRLRGHNAEGERFSIAIEKPFEKSKVQFKAIRVTNLAVASSGDYRNFFLHDGHRYSHMINPGTGRPIDHALASVTVISDTAAFADAMATALLVLGPEDGPALAEDLGVAAYFALNSERGIKDQSTSEFDRLTQQ